MKNGQNLSQLRRELRQSIRKEIILRSTRRNIYLVNDFVIGKLGCTNELTKREYDIGKYLFENGINVPEMYGLIKLNPLWIRMNRRSLRYTLSNLAILMQRIPEKSNLNRDEALVLYHKELEKVSELDIYPRDCGLHNAIFNSEEVYLIDFESWRKIK